MFKRTIIFGIAALATLAFAATKLSIEVGTIGDGATAEWVATGEGKGQTALQLCKNVPTAEFEAAGADIGGVNGLLVTDLTYLSFNAVDPILSTGSPRWNIYFGPNDGDQWNITGVAFLGKTAEAGQTVAYTEEEIQAALVAAGAVDSDVVKFLQIIVDEEGCALLDNVRVGVAGTTTTFTGNGKANRGKGFLNNGK
ncbi:MAG TPA: hypothetical protein VGE01_12410 [Fimbriimonas sp.]